jgi:alkanesulfonate monooxygenase SsuD/methylene tetrahydromethanopterin reductase-like flavin-dependent oxidoreductase (luciferase family)
MKFHLVVPAGRPTPADLPGFITDVRPADRGYAHRQAARSAELAGWSGVAVPFDPSGLDPLVVAAGLLRDTSAVQVTAAFHPAVGTPVYAAKLSASLQRFTGSRLAWFVQVDLDPATARAQGDFLAGQDRYARAAEFLSVARLIWDGTDATYTGRYYQVLGGGLPPSPRAARPFPLVYLSGTSPEALALSAEHADVHVVGPGDDPGAVPAGVARAVRLPPDGLGLVDDYTRQGITEFFVTSADPVADAFRIREAAGVR